ncbi:MAG: aldehyde dehydrogenase family protein [Nitrososphaerota archaeon]|nr:aldehyde dehydrogenase family protein [Nitrososphaerota archaeon]MDG6922941.1 aldehyde dehydrogenase family protein [Nitrososphaerota archaeon]
MSFKTDDEAIELANSSRYGLACGLWSKDHTRARGLQER